MGEKGQIVEVGDAAPPRPIHWRLILLATLTALVAIFYFSGLSDYVSWDELTSTIGATIAFLSSRYLFRDFVRRWFGRWLAIVDRGIERDGAHYLLMLRLSPVVPFFAVNATMGLTNIRTRTFVWVSQIGLLPSCILYVLAGTQIMHINSLKDVLSVELIVILSLLAFAPLILKWLFFRRTPS